MEFLPFIMVQLSGYLMLEKRVIELAEHSIGVQRTNGFNTEAVVQEELSCKRIKSWVLSCMAIITK